MKLFVTCPECGKSDFNIEEEGYVCSHCGKAGYSLDAQFERDHIFVCTVQQEGEETDICTVFLAESIGYAEDWLRGVVDDLIKDEYVALDDEGNKMTTRSAVETLGVKRSFVAEFRECDMEDYQNYYYVAVRPCPIGKSTGEVAMF